MEEQLPAWLGFIVLGCMLLSSAVILYSIYCAGRNAAMREQMDKDYKDLEKKYGRED